MRSSSSKTHVLHHKSHCKTNALQHGSIRLQQPIRITIQVYDLQRPYVLQFELKAKRQAGLSKSKHSKALIKAEVIIRQGFGHSSLKIQEKNNKIRLASNSNLSFTENDMAPSIVMNWRQRVNIDSKKGLMSQNNKPLTKPMMSYSPLSSDTSNATNFICQQHTTPIGLIPRRPRSWIYRETNSYPREHRKSF